MNCIDDDSVFDVCCSKWLNPTVYGAGMSVNQAAIRQGGKAGCEWKFIKEQL